MQITKHFTYNELTRTNYTQFERKNRLLGKEFIGNMRLVCYYILEPIRIRYGVPVFVSSCFRCLPLHYYIYGEINKIREKKGLELLKVPLTSQHLLAQAVDFTVKGIECEKVFEFMQFQDYLKFGQLILEKQDEVEWIHCSLPTLENNGQILIFENGGYRRIK